jgi:hypothetical protein
VIGLRTKRSPAWMARRWSSSPAYPLISTIGVGHLGPGSPRPRRGPSIRA